MTTLSQIVGKVHALQLKQNFKEIVSQEAGSTFSGAVNEVSKIVNFYEDAKTLGSEGSYSEFARIANLEPRVMVEENLKTVPQMGKFLMGLTNIFSAYYLQSVSLTAIINDVSVVAMLDKFNPNRDASVSKLIKFINDARTNKSSIYPKYAKESYSYVLPNYKDYGDVPLKMHTALEADPPHIAARKRLQEMANQNAQNNAQSTGNQGSSSTSTNAKGDTFHEYHNSTIENVKGSKTVVNGNNYNISQAPKEARVQISGGLKNIQEADNLAVGRLLQVKLTQNDMTYEVPVAVRMRPMYVPRLIMAELVKMGDVTQSWKERWHKMRSGEISFVSDWIFQSDIINHRRKLLAMDKQGLYRELINRRKNNKKAALATGQASIGAASAFIIVSAQTMRQVELELGQEIKDPQFRNRIFGENSAMMLIIIDTEWERVITYTRGLNEGSDYSFKEFEGFGKGNGPDITEIMKAYAVGHNPRF